MNGIEATVILTGTGCAIAYSLYCTAKLRGLLVQHGKRPGSILWNSAFLQYAKLSRHLIRELDNEEDIREIKTALSRADISIVLVCVVFFALIGLFAAR